MFNCASNVQGFTVTYRKFKTESHFNCGWSSGIVLIELWYRFNRSNIIKSHISSGNSAKRFLDRSKKHRIRQFPSVLSNKRAKVSNKVGFVIFYLLLWHRLAHNHSHNQENLSVLCCLDGAILSPLPLRSISLYFCCQSWLKQVVGV